METQVIGCHALTFHDSRQAYALLRGVQPLLPWSRTLPPGWYHVHVGNIEELDASLHECLVASLPSAPGVSRCFIGRLHISREVSDRVIDHVSPANMWVRVSKGQRLHHIDESFEFGQPVLRVVGARGVWRIIRTELRCQVQSAVGIRRVFVDVYPVEKAAVKRKWNLRCAPRKQYERRVSRRIHGDGEPNFALTSEDTRKRRKLSDFDEQPASQPASLVVSDDAVDQRGGLPLSLAQRIAFGRTASRLLHLRSIHLLGNRDSFNSASSTEVRGGRFAKLHDQDVFILKRFSRYGVPMADVLPLHPKGTDNAILCARLRDARSCRQSELTDVNARYVPVCHRARCELMRTSLKFRRRPSPDSAQGKSECATDDNAALIIAQLWSGSLGSNPAAVCSHTDGDVVVMSVAASRHIDETTAAGEPHSLQLYSRKKRERRVLDLPLPWKINVAGHRCRTCECKFGIYNGFPVRGTDVQAVRPDILIHSTAKFGTTYMTRRFLLYCVQQFNETLNSMHLRRDLASLYAANCLALHTGPTALACLCAIPSPQGLRSMLTVALEHFLPAACEHMRRHVNCYSGQILRSDGNWDIAMRVGQPGENMRWEHPWTVLHAICLTDGSLSDLPSLMATEGWEGVEADLNRVVYNINADRVEAGFGNAGSPIVAHAVDTYGKLRLKLDAFYKRKYAAVNVAVLAPTPRADASAAVAAGAGYASPTELCGDPGHDSFALNRLVSPTANDANDIRFDHKYHMSSLSAPLAVFDRTLKPQEPPAVVHSLLRSAVRDPTATFKGTLAVDAVGRLPFLAFLGEPNVSNARVWKKLFRAHPPRGTIARIARRAGAELHPSMRKRNFIHMREFIRETKRIKRWYKRGKRLTRFRRGIQRYRRAASQVRGVTSVWTQKVAMHYQRLLRPLRIEGLWRWRRVALATREAGVPVQSGTLPTERFWSVLKQMLPPAGRHLTKRWFELLLGLCYLRYNYQLFNSRRFKGWMHNDTLLAQRIDVLAAAVAAMESDQESLQHLLPVFEPFRA